MFKIRVAITVQSRCLCKLFFAIARRGWEHNAALAPEERSRGVVETVQEEGQDNVGPEQEAHQRWTNQQCPEIVPTERNYNVAEPLTCRAASAWGSDSQGVDPSLCALVPPGTTTPRRTRVRVQEQPKRIEKNSCRCSIHDILCLFCVVSLVLFFV
jgi:hypothetical protein